MKTYKELLEHCKKHSDWMYVYGMKGEVLTNEKYVSLKKQYGNMVWNSDAKKIGKVCCDCSGLISSCTGILRNSTSFKANAPQTVSIAELKKNWSKYIGWGLWLQGHIGVVSDTEGYYYAMDGSARNWVHYPLSKNSWTHCIQLCDIDYSNNQPAPTPQPQPAPKGQIDVFYRVKTAQGWLPEVKNLTDYAGIRNKQITGFAVRVPNHSVKYRVHLTSGKWLPYVTGYNTSDYDNGYAGDDRTPIDAIEITSDAPIVYRVAVIGSRNYYEWQHQNSKTGGQDGYAGAFGNKIDRVQIYIGES